MKISDLLLMCLGNLWRRKARTILTVFGVIIGTCSIVVMISLGVGIKEYEMSWLEDMGDLSIITVYRNWENQDIKLDADAVRKMKEMDTVAAATPFEYLDTWGSVILQSDDRYKYQGTIYGVDFDALSELGYEVSEGRMPADSDKKGAMIFGSKAAYQFMDVKRKRNNYIDSEPDENGIVKDPFVDPLKDKMSFNLMDSDKDEYDKIPEKVYDDKVRCIGILDDGETYNYQFDKTYATYVDVEYAHELINAYYKENKIRNTDTSSYDQVYVKAASIDVVEDVETAIRDMGFETYSMSSTRQNIEEEMKTIELVLGGLGAVSMLVAALSITNTMVMSIYERTREIGIMKVIGCRLRDIRWQFLVEAGLIGFIGGLAGLVFSFIISKVLNVVLAGSVGYGDSLSIIPLWLALLGLGFATGVGLISGFGPANRAVNISALEAIKHE